MVFVGLLGQDWMIQNNTFDAMLDDPNQHIWPKWKKSLLLLKVERSTTV